MAEPESGAEHDAETEPVADSPPAPATGTEPGSGPEVRTTEAGSGIEQTSPPDPDPASEEGASRASRASRAERTSPPPGIEPTLPGPVPVRRRPALRVLGASAAVLIAVAVLGSLTARDSGSGPEPLTFDGHPGQVETAGFAPAGSTLATAGGDSTTRVWDTATGQELHVLQGHVRAVTAIAYAPHGETLATASEDHSARIWDVRSGEEVGLLEGHEKTVTSVAYAPNRRGWPPAARTRPHGSGRPRPTTPPGPRRTRQRRHLRVLLPGQ
ncbi:hypothetical protein KGD82_02580 [Nocardiopsis eucommiae]|uniref:Uncharacterized protein n=1 Tax=Nocardiopsis eucommiae TaxID=2831970 RepID=A0A975LAZ3_9ACTN|nr:hypothetical protein KGD82_02580 [Nocardiopsis eucommiae]